MIINTNNNIIQNITIFTNFKILIIMKKFFKNLMPMLLLVAGLGISPNLWAYSISSGVTLYFNNTNGWSNVYLTCYGNNWSNDESFTNITGTNIWYKTFSGGYSADGFVFRSNTSNWNQQCNDIKTNITSATLFTPKSSDNKCDMYWNTDIKKASASKYVYFINTGDFAKCYFRIGNNPSGHMGTNTADKMTNISNTKIYYYQTRKWEGYQAFSVANSAGWTGANTIYQPYNDGGIKPNGDYAITKQTAFQKVDISNNVLFSISTVNKTEDGCAYYNTTYTTNVSYSSLNVTHTVGVKVKAVGASSFVAPSSTPGEVSASSYNLTAATTSAATNASLSGTTVSKTFSGAKTATTTFSAPTITGYTFKGWYNESGTKQYDDAEITIYPTIATTLYAYYEETAYTINVQSDDTGYGIVAASSVSAGQITSVTLPAASVNGAAYKFVNWTTSDACITINNSTSATTATITATGTGTVTANFALAATYDLTVAKGTGITSVSGGKSGQTTIPFDGGTISATVKEGYEFDKWTADPAANATFADANSATTTVTIQNGSVTVTANATAKSYAINYPSGTGYTITGNPATGATDATITFTVTPATKYSVVVKQDGNTLTMGASNQYSFTMPAHDVNITVEAEYQSGWYMFGSDTWGGDWDPKNATVQFTQSYRGMANVYYVATTMPKDKYFRITDKGNDNYQYSISDNTTSDAKVTKGTIYDIKVNTSKAAYSETNLGSVWAIIKTSNTKKFAVIDPVSTFYTVSVSGANDHGSYTLKDKAWDLATDQYSANDTYVLTITTTDAYLPSLTVNGSPVSWKSSTTTTYTYEGKATAATTLAVSYVPHFKVTFGYATGCSSTQGSYTVKNGSASVTSGSYIINGTELTFTATPNEGYQFDGWYTASTGGTKESELETYNKTINATTSLYAKFSKKVWNVTVAADGNGTGTLAPVAGTYQVNQVDGQSFTATPAKGSWFEGWTKSPEDGGDWTGDTFKPTKDVTITATFTKYTSSLSVTGVNVGKTATVTFTKDEHYSNPTITYELWNSDKSAKITDGTTFTPTETGATFIAQVAENYTVKAIVTQNSKIVDEVFSNAFTIGAVYTVNFAVSPTGKGCTVTPATPKEDVIIDIPFEISATNGTGYHFNKWVADPAANFTFGTGGEGDDTEASTTAKMTAAAVTSTITATFSPNAYVVRFNANSPTGQKATGTMEDQSFEYDEAAKALTENAFVRLGYTFLGWATTADGTKEYDDKQAVQNLANESGAIVNLYAVWQLKTDCSITVTQPAAEDGTIAPSTKVTGANVEGTTYTYTFNPKDNSVTFMNWTITNAICVEGTNERSNPVKIKTYGEATIRANVKENLVSVTLKMLPDDYWGYFKVNGNNVASGTVINVGAKTTATVFANTNFGYKFVEFEKSDGFDNLINFNDGTMQGKGAVGKVTLIARFAEDNSTDWWLGGFGDTWDWYEFKKHSGETTKKIAYFEQELKSGSPRFKIKKGSSTYYGNSGTMTDVYNAGWVFKTSEGKDCNIDLGGHSGTYLFCLDYSDENNPKVTVLYPYHTLNPNTTIYFNNYHNAVNWPNPVLRIGTDDNFAEGYAMKLVPGTANLYSYTFVEGWRNYKEFVICDNWGWTGAKDKTNDASYGIMNIGQGDYKIKHSITHYNGITVDNVEGKYDYVIQPTGFSHDGDYGVKYYSTSHFSNREASKYTVTFNNKNYTGGTLKVEQWENYDGSARTELNTGTTKVDQSRWITITATPQIGYKFVKMSVTTKDGNTENHYQTTWKYAVQQNITAITATFAPVNTYTFYVKNVAASDTKWHNGGTKDVYLYYANESGTSYWGWPGLMATPMDNNHEWYKVEMTNAYFDIHHWRLNNGAGADCPQTDEYATNNGVPVFNSESMEGKYYELVYDKEGDNYETYKLQAATTTPSFYRVITNDGKYTSNVAKVGEIVSFFATTAGAKLQKSGQNGWENVIDGTISISENNVYVATISEDAISTPEVYTGNYYIRTDGASGQWGEYKDPSKNNAMTYFTPRQGETYSYYWVKNLGKFDKDESSGSFNVKAKVANDYNDNLAGEIANDANTNIYGNINKTTNGSNVRFSYEPTTNAFERAILSGSAEDSYLNIVGDHIYSDESCKSDFALNMDTYKNNPKACKLRDISDWVYEMTIYAEVPNNTTNIGVDMYSLYNGNRSTLLDNKVIMASGTGEGKYKLRATYDFKKNRIITSWAPSSQEITQTMVVNADIMFMQVEKGDVSQITLSKTTDPNVKSLEYLLYVLEIEDPGEGKRKEEHYRISLPFDCRVSDIYGLENYVKLNEAGQLISGDWGIQKYNGELRAQQGWYDNSPIQNFWTWLSKDDTLKAGRGYSVSIDKSAFTWATIGEEVTRTICDANGTNCQDITTTEDRASHRLYFPSMQPGFDLKNSGASAINYPAIHCEKTQGNRDVYDSDWRFIGSSAYNNITTKTVTPEQSVAPAPAYLYVLNAAETEYEAVAAAENFVYHSFGAYMMQFHGDIEWNIYTQSQPESPASAPRYSAIAHTPLKMHVDVMEGEERAAQTFLELNDQATTGFDQKMDLTLMKSSKVARAYTTTEGIDYAANCLPFESTIVPMTVNTLHAGDYTLHLEGADNVAVYLIDYQLQTETLISAGDVEVELGKGSSSDRFALRFDVAASPTDSKNAKGETIVNDGQKTQKLLINSNIYLINAGRIYNVLGARP